jgi:hypothetical protein
MCMYGILRPTMFGKYFLNKTSLMEVQKTHFKLLLSIKINKNI